jgi:type I restriction enzyme, S subunit
MAPAGWHIEPIKNRLRLEYGTSLIDSERRDGSFPVYGSNGKVGTHSSYCVEGPGILVGRKGSVGEIHYSEDSFWPIDTVYHVRRLRDDDWRFLYYLLRYLSLGQLNAATGVPGLTRRDAHFILGAFPERNEQVELASILKMADDAFAAAEVKLVAARRLKTALMQRLFTRGIPGRHTRFKQTKIGEIPETWEPVTVQSVLHAMPFNGISPQSRPEPPGTPILNVECIDRGFCSLEHVSYVDVDIQDRESYRAMTGDFFVLRGNGNRTYVATGGLLTTEPHVPTIFSDKLIRLRFDPEKVVDRFVPYQWQSPAFLRRIQSKAESGSGLWMISKRDIRRELVARPMSLDEQSEIVSFIDAAIASIHALEAEVTNLARLKHSLLQNLLTGRIRVRS